MTSSEVPTVAANLASGGFLSGAADWFGTGQRPPHGFCLLWDPNLIAIQLLGQGGIAIAYLMIPTLIMYQTLRMENLTRLQFLIRLEFSAFITCCAISHILECMTFYYDIYWTQAIWLNVTSAVSLMTAVTMPFAGRSVIKHAAKSAVLKILQDPSNTLKDM